MHTLIERFSTPLLAFLCLPDGGDVPAGLHVNTQGGEGAAIGGFDPIAYAVDGRPRQGRPDLSAILGGASWRFATEAHLQRFLQAPGRYLPAFGGFCAASLSLGSLRSVDPVIFGIVRGRLHLFRDRTARAAWLADMATRLPAAERNWRDLTAAGSRPQ